VATTRVAVPGVRSRAERAEGARERFLTWPRALAVGVFVLFAATFDEGKVHEDGLVYFDFLRRLFGADTPAAAYQFGSAFWNAPFYLVSQLVAVRGGLDRYHSGEIATAVASNAATVAILYLGWRLLRALDLPRGPAVLLLTLFGTPLYYYGALWVSYKHAADTLYATALLWFVYRSTQADARRRDYAAAGACLALLLATRYANVAFWFGVLVVLFVLGYRRAAAWTAGAAVVATGVLFLLPVVRHIPYTSPPATTLAAPFIGEGRYALSAPGFVHPVSRGMHFSVTAPLKMLFTLKRGLFVWTPLTAFATVGFVLLLRRLPSQRPFLAAAGVCAVALVAIHSLWGAGLAWAGGGSFSQRFLTALFPVFLLGTAEIVRRFGPPAIAVLTLCACFSLWIGLTQFNGYYGSGADDSITKIIGNYKSLTGPTVNKYHTPPPYDSVENFGRQIGYRVEHRWQLLWRVVA